MNISSPSCVSGIFQYVDAMVLSPSASVDENEDDSLHHLLVERWFRERFFLPRPYRSTSIVYDDDDGTQNDIIDDGSSGQSMALFSDNLVSKEIRSNIIPVNDGAEYCFDSVRRHKSGISKEATGLKHRSSIFEKKRRPPLGVVMVVDNGAPLMPLSRDQEDDDERMEAASKDSSEEKTDDEIACRPSMGFIQRTFSFDEQLPIIHRRRAASIRSLNKCMEEDDDCYLDNHHQPSFTIPVTYSNEGNRSKVVYPVPVPASP